MSNGFPKFIGLTLTQSGGMLGAWEDGSVARWVPAEYRPDFQNRDENGDPTRVLVRDGHWVAIPSPDYEALFCTTTKTYTRATDTLDLTLAPDIAVED